MLMAIALPIGLVLAYGGARTLSLAFAELRDAVFAKVGQRAIRQVALEVFRHLHALSLRFHLERQTGGLTRAIERGTKAISTLLSYSLFSILPTLFEILVVSITVMPSLEICWLRENSITKGSMT
jgi:ATP-binding cassette subfamily B protein